MLRQRLRPPHFSPHRCCYHSNQATSNATARDGGRWWKPRPSSSYAAESTPESSSKRLDGGLHLYPPIALEMVLPYIGVVVCRLCLDAMRQYPPIVYAPSHTHPHPPASRLLEDDISCFPKHLCWRPCSPIQHDMLPTINRHHPLLASMSAAVLQAKLMVVLSSSEHFPTPPTIPTPLWIVPATWIGRSVLCFGECACWCSPGVGREICC